MTQPLKILRCAIYTRKSSEEGLEQDFNSLHAQREACEAYIASQKHEGWKLIPTPYDDGGFTGGNMARPGLKQLMEDIGAGRIDVIVVYKVDRLSRSLHDFARMVEVFDKHNVSFVSVTQQFNTSTPMGRLMLNVLLSFAQFEREVTGERIRDKIAASKKKGMWMGGYAPLGYDIVDRKLIINPAEAKTIRDIYGHYLELGGVRQLQEHLVKQGIHSKTRDAVSRPGGSAFSRGALYHLLSNPIYMGQIRFKDVCYPGQHEGIIDPALWDKVQQHLANNRMGQVTHLRKTEPGSLTGKIVDGRTGEPLVVVHANKKGRRYRYYISQSLKRGIKSETPDGWRLPGQQIEQTILGLAQAMLNDRDAIVTALQASGTPSHHIPGILHTAKGTSHSIDSRTIFDRHIQKVELRPDGMRVTLSLQSIIPEHEGTPVIIMRDIPMQMKRRGIEMRLVIEGEYSLRTNADRTLIKTIARAHAWSSELLSGCIASMADIASREGISDSYVKKLMPLAFLAPEIITAITAGTQPAHLTTQMLIREMDIPLDWQEQKRILGFSA